MSFFSDCLHDFLFTAGFKQFDFDVPPFGFLHGVWVSHIGRFMVSSSWGESPQILLMHLPFLWGPRFTCVQVLTSHNSIEKEDPFLFWAPFPFLSFWMVSAAGLPR